MCYITANVLQIKVDGQIDKLVTELVDNISDGRRFQVIASYLPKVANFNLSQLHLTPLLGVTPFEF